MNRIFSWFQSKNATPSSTITNRRDFIQSFIFHQRTKEFLSCLRQRGDQELCIEAYFGLLSTTLDEKYMSDLFQLIVKKSRFTSDQLSMIIAGKLSHAILDKNFDYCEKILHLPLQSLKILLGTFEITQLLHKCTNINQLTSCLSIIIERNLPYDSEYLSWILLVIFEHYTTGDEFIIEYLLNVNKNIHFLFVSYGNNNVTPMMLFFHSYSNMKCQTLIDTYLSNITDQSVLLQCDKWNRSYLMHLLCGKCEHEHNESCLEMLDEDISDINKIFIDRCQHASTILSRFSMLYKLGCRLDTPIKTILTSQFCLSLRIVLFNFLLMNDPVIELQLNEFFNHFPGEYIPIYSNYLKKIVRKQNINHCLTSLLFNYGQGSRCSDRKIEFLLTQGARIDRINNINDAIVHMIAHTHSSIPFTLLNYSVYADISYAIWLNNRIPRMQFYICRLIQCGYTTEIRTKFQDFESSLPEHHRKLLEKMIDVKNPSRLSSLCFQKIRMSAKNLGDETIEKLKYDMPARLQKSIVYFGHDESRDFYRSVEL